MRKIVVSTSVSLDGFFEGPDHDLSWHRVDEELHAYFNDYLAATSVFLDGRVTHELMASSWPAAAETLKAEPGADMVVGGAQLVDAFRRLDLIDEYRIFVHPVLVGAGTPFFRQADALTALDLLDTRTFGNGVVLLRYGRSAPAIAG